MRRRPTAPPRDRRQPPPDCQVDRPLDEADRAVAEEDIDPAGMPARGGHHHRADVVLVAAQQAAILVRNNYMLISRIEDVAIRPASARELHRAREAGHRHAVHAGASLVGRVGEVVIPLGVGPGHAAQASLAEHRGRAHPIAHGPRGDGTLIPERTVVLPGEVIRPCPGAGAVAVVAEVVRVARLVGVGRAEEQLDLGRDRGNIRGAEVLVADPGDSGEVQRVEQRRLLQVGQQLRLSRPPRRVAPGPGTPDAERVDTDRSLVVGQGQADLPEVVLTSATPGHLPGRLHRRHE